MPRLRTLWLDRLKVESVTEYVRLHKQVWPELEAVYRQAGILQLGCYLNGCDRVVYMEYETETYDKAKANLDCNPVEIRWQALMKEFCDPTIERKNFSEVYTLPPIPLEQV